MRTEKSNDLQFQYGDEYLTISQIDNLFPEVKVNRYSALPALFPLKKKGEFTLYLHISGRYFIIDNKGIVQECLQNYVAAENKLETWQPEFKQPQDCIKMSKEHFVENVKKGNVKAKLVYGHRQNTPDEDFCKFVKRKGYGSIDIYRPGRGYSAVFYIKETSSNLLFITSTELYVFSPAYRMYNDNEAETVTLWEKMRDPKAEMLDAMTDGSGEYYRKKSFFEERGCGHLMGQTYKGLVRDEKVKGKLSLYYQLQIKDE